MRSTLFVVFEVRDLRDETRSTSVLANGGIDTFWMIIRLNCIVIYMAVVRSSLFRHFPY